MLAAAVRSFFSYIENIVTIMQNEPNLQKATQIEPQGMEKNRDDLDSAVLEASPISALPWYKFPILLKLGWAEFLSYAPAKEWKSEWPQTSH